MKCYDCGEEKGAIAYGNDFLCEGCYNYCYHRCYHCDTVHHNDDLRYIEDNIVCGDCIPRHYRYCDHCDEWRSDTMVDCTGLVLCMACYQDYFYTCESCNRFVRHDDVYIHRGEVYCESCDPGSGVIRDYDHKLYLRYLGKGDLYFGVELEVECNNDTMDTASDFDNEFDGDERLFCLKEDSSLSDGFEIVTQPASLEYHLEKFGWEEMLRSLRRNGCESHDPGTCGLHIHASRKAISKTTQVNIAYFVNAQAKLMEQLARRSSNSYAKIKKKEITELNENIDRNGALYNDDRREAVNYQNDNTVEFRLWRGTLRWETLAATLEITHAIIKFCEVYSSVNIRDDAGARRDFIKFVLKGGYSYAVEYMKMRGVI